MASRCGKANKIMKKNFFLTAMAIVAVASVCFFSAFKVQTVVKAQDDNPFWRYNGGDSLQSASYSQTSGIPCEGEENICMVQAPAIANSNPAQPELSTQLKERITNHDTSEGDVFLKEE